MDVGEGETLVNKYVLSIEAITTQGPIVRRMLNADQKTQALQWTEHTRSHHDTPGTPTHNLRKPRSQPGSLQNKPSLAALMGEPAPQSL